MREINCIVPVQVRISGSPDDVDEGQLATCIANAVQSRLQFSAEQLLKQYCPLPAPCFHTPEITFPGGTSHQLKTRLQDLITQAIESTIAGQPAAAATPRFVLAGYQAPSPPRKPTQPWSITYKKSFLTKLRDFVELRASWAGASSRNSANEEVKALYGDRLEEVFTANVWVATTKVPMLLDDLAEAVSQSALSLEHKGRFVPWAWAVTSEARFELLNIAGAALADLPSVYANRRGVLPDGGAYLNYGGKLIFIFLSLPEMQLDVLADLSKAIDAVVQVRDLTPWINIVQFREFFKIDWADYVQEFGNNQALLTISPFHTMRKTSADALRFLLRETVVTAIDADEAVFGRLQLMNAETVRSLPAPSRSAFTQMWEEGFWAAVSSERASGPWEAGWFGAYIHTVVGPSAEEREASRYGPEAKHIADRVIDLLKNHDDNDRRRWKLLNFLLLEFRTNAYRYRRSAQLGFQYFLKQLEEREGGRWFNAFFDAVEDADNGDLHHFVVELCQDTGYALYPRVERDRELLNTRRRNYLKNEYDVANKQIVLDKKPSLRIKPGDFIKALSRKDKRIDPKRLAELQTAVDGISKDLLGKLLRGEDKTSYSQEEFATEVLKQASRAINLSNDDLEEFTVQRWLRFVDLRPENEGGLERVYVTYDYYDQINNEAPVPVRGSRKTISDSDFEFLLWSWEFAETAAFWDTATKVLSLGVVLVVAWEIGAIAFLVELAGGVAALSISIGISELIYICTAKHLTLEGFLIAALEGYCFSVGFRFGGGIGDFLANRIGADSIEKLILGWIVEKLATGIVGGASSAFLIKFSNDILNILAGRQQGLSRFSDYVRTVEIGAVTGVLLEFASVPLKPVLSRLGRQGQETVSSILEKVRDEGIGLRTWTGLMDEALSKLSEQLRQAFDAVKLKDVPEAFAGRIKEITQAMLDRLESDIVARVVRLRRLNVTPGATRGLERLLDAVGGQIEERELFELLNRLQSRPAQLRQMFEAWETLDEAALKALADPAKLNAFADTFAPKPIPAPAPPKPPTAHPEAPKPAVPTAQTPEPAKVPADDPTPHSDKPAETAGTGDPRATPPDPPKFKPLDDILTPDREGFIDPRLDAAYKEYCAEQIRRGLKPATPEVWARRVTSGKPRIILEDELGPDYARQGGESKTITLSDIPRPSALTATRLQGALARLRQRLSKVFERLGNLQTQGIVDGGVNSGHFNIAKGNVAEVLSEEIQDTVLAEVRKKYPKAEIIRGVKVRLGENSEAKLFTDNLIGTFRGNDLWIHGKFEVKSGARGGADATVQVFEWVEGRLTDGSQILIPGRSPYVWHPETAVAGEVIGLANAQAYLITAEGAELYGTDSAMQTVGRHERLALPYTASELDYITREAIETLIP